MNLGRAIPTFMLCRNKRQGARENISMCHRHPATGSSVIGPLPVDPSAIGPATIGPSAIGPLSKGVCKTDLLAIRVPILLPVLAGDFVRERLRGPSQ